MKKKRKRKKSDAAKRPLKDSAVREFTRPVTATFSGDDLWLMMSHIRARKAFACEPPESALAVFFGHVATVVSKTYAEMGEDAKLADDVALMLIRDLLLDLDAGIVERHRKHKLPPRPRAV